MTGSELREGLARLSEQVTPEPEPYERLLTRARRRRQRLSLAGAGVVGTAAALVAIQVAAQLAVPTGGQLARPSESQVAGQIGGLVDASPGTGQLAAPIDSPWVRRLLDSPTRGSLAADGATVDEIARGFLAARDQLMIDPSLTRVRVLFAHDLSHARVVVVAFVDDDHAIIRTAFADAGAAVPAVVAAAANGVTSLGRQPLSPVVITGRPTTTPAGGDFLALGPAGCVPETSSGGRLGPAGVVTRTWRATGTDGFVVAGPNLPAERWRFTCDGAVRQSGPTTVDAGPLSPASPPTSVPGGRGRVDPTIAGAAARDLTDAMAENGLAPAPVRVVWGGAIPGTADKTPAVVVVACHPTACAAGLATGDPSLGTHLGVGRPDLVALLIPGDPDGVLVVGPERAVTAELLDAGGGVISAGRLSDGVGALTVDVATVASVNVYDAAGDLIDRMPTAPDLGSVHFGEPYVVAW